MGRAPLSIVYLLEDTTLFGGVKIVLRQANLMAARGHRVTVVSPGAPPSWFDLEADFLQTPGLDPDDIPAADVTVATFWTTIARAIAGAKGEAVHYCQGFEATYTHNQAEHATILDAYAQPIPGIALSPHLADIVGRRFGRPVRLVPYALATRWSPRSPVRDDAIPRILITSPFEIDWKGVPTALEAVRILRSRGQSCQVVRLSQWPQCAEEKALLDADEFHEHLEPSRVPALVRSCDLHLAPSWEQEGLGMPVLESMACGVPVVASDISSFRGFASGSAQLVPFDDAEAFADATAEILGSASRWQKMHYAGVEAAAAFSPERVAQQAEDALYWVASGAWRDEH